MYRLSKAVRTTSGPEEAVLLDISQGRMFSLNPVATKIVEHLVEERSTSDIVERISTDFSIRPEEAAADFQQFLEILKDNKLVETDPSSDR